MKALKKITAVLLALLFVFSPLAGVPFDLPVFAATSGKTGDCTWSLSGTTLTISGNGAMENYSSGGPWGSGITKVMIEDGVTTIGDYAFFSCRNLTSVTIPDSVTSINYGAFGYCDSLTSIIIPDSITTIDSCVFAYCDSLTSVVIPDSVTSIDYGAFGYCDSLTDLTIPDSVTSIGSLAFVYCVSLTSIIIPDSVTSIGSGAFSGGDSLTTLSVVSGNPIYHSNGNCIIETKSKTLIQGCSNSTIPADGSVTSIGEYAFHHFDDLTSITIPDSVTTIGYLAFFGCSSLTDVWYEGSAEDRARISIGSDNDDFTNATWHYNVCKEHTYDNACDTTCNKCDFVRQGPSHIYDNACDADCNVCGQNRTTPHDYTVWDKDENYHWMKCPLCGRVDESTRTAHVYDNACDTDCNVCGNARIPSDHVYDSVCDVDCNVCGGDRTPPHDYTVQDMDETNHWMKCSLCGRVNESTRASHVYDNPCEDSDCNVCGEDRIPPHMYDSASDYECNLCLIRRPAAPKSESVVGTTVTLKTVEGCEYSTDGFTWQASPVFEDLEPVTTYTFYQRYGETAIYYASAASLGTKITTKKGTPAAPSAPTAEEITKTSVTLVMEEGMQYSLDGTTWKTSPVFTGLRRGGVYTFYARLSETSTHYASPASEALEVQTLKDPQLAPKAPTLVKLFGTSVTLFSAEGIEYSMDGETWQSEATFRGLAPNTEYTFYQRQAEKDEYYASPASDPLVVKTLPVIPGDADGNEAITMDDALYVLFHTSFPEDYPVNQDFDFNNSGKVDMDDAIELLYYVFFPERYPLF